MASAAENCYGMALQVHDGTSTYTSVAEVTAVNGFGITFETADITSFESSDGIREFKATLGSGDEVQLTCNLLKDNATQDFTSGLGYLATSRTTRKFRFLHPNTSTVLWEFYAVVTKVTAATPLNGVFSFTVTLKPTGAPVTKF